LREIFFVAVDFGMGFFVGTIAEELMDTDIELG
jgi:hypothetical protein